MALMYCRDCKIEVDTDIHKRCPQCNQSKNGLYYAEDSILLETPTESSPAQVTSTPNSHGHEDTNFTSLVLAQNRTTHAVRSLAINFVAAPIVSLVAFVVILLAIRSGNSPLILLAGSGSVLALLIMLIKSLDELSKSKI